MIDALFQNFTGEAKENCVNNQRHGGAVFIVSVL
jgi:hypothetical protein